MQEARRLKATQTKTIICLGKTSKRIDWPDVKVLGALAVAGSVVGVNPQLGSAIGGFVFL